MSGYECVIDLETLGLRNTSVIVSVGAALVRAGGEEGITASGYWNLSDTIDEQIRLGRTIDQGTLSWWMGQNVKVREVFAAGDGRSVKDTMKAIASWMSEFPINGVWGYGSDFDNSLLRSLFDAADVSCPWRYTKSRCYRTLKAMYPGVPYEKPELAHNALQDARAEAIHLQRILNEVIACPA